jgi:hypothetical protein
MKNSTFAIETFPGREFVGFTKDEDWNGWACPYFIFDEGMKIVEASGTGNARYDDDNDQFVFMLGDDEETYPAVIENGQKLYPIGNGAWIWEEKQ